MFFGIPPYNTTTGGPDNVNLSNLAIHYSIPVFSRPGRGTPFSFTLNFDQVVWSVGSVGGNNTWQPFFPFSGGGLNGIGAVFYNTAQAAKQCTDGLGDFFTYYIETISSFQDSQGTTHPFGTVGVQVSNIDPSWGGSCTLLLRSYPNSKTGLTSDGSAITVNVSYGAQATLTTPHGDVISPPMVTYSNFNWIVGCSPCSITDSNGNQVTEVQPSGNLTHFTSVTDNLNTYAVTASGTYPSPISYTYTAPSGASASYTMSFKSYTIQSSFGCANVNEYPATTIQILDKITLPDGSYYQFNRELLSNGNSTGRLSSVHLPTGGTISYTYSGVVCQDGSPVTMTRTTPDGQWQYARKNIVINGLYQVGSSTTTVTDPLQNQTVINFAGGPETQRQIYTGTATGTPLETIITCYNGTALSNCPTASSLGATAFNEINVYRSLNGGSNSRVDTFYNTATGQVTEKDEYDFGGSTPLRKTTISYATLGNGIVDRPSVVTVVDSAGNLQSQTSYTYDEDANTLVASGAAQHVGVTCVPSNETCRGNVTTLKKYVTGSTYLTQTFTHYDTGLVNQSTDVNGAQTTTTAGACNDSLPTQVSMPLTLSVTYAWNCTGGVVKQVTDSNNQSTYSNYTTDRYFWRPESTKDQLGNLTSLTYASLNQTESVLPVIAGTSNVDIVTITDSLGRALLTQKRQAPGSTNFDTTIQWYDADGRLAHQSMPYVGTLDQTCCNTPATSIFYDGMSRVTSFMDSSNTTVKTTTYTQNDTYTDLIAPAGESDKRKQLQYDGLGRLTSVCEVTAGTTSYPGGACGQYVSKTGYSTTYAYNLSPNFNSLTVTQSAQGGTSQTRKYIYDMLGRMTSETNPESGTTMYTYDADGTCGTSNGDLVKRIDANGSTTCYSYDAGHRLISVTYPGSSTTDSKYFVYDASTISGYTISNPKGRMVEAYTCPPTGGCSPKKTDLVFSYSARGEVAAVYESTPHSGAYYTLTASYWPHGLLNTLSGLPGLPTLTFGANNSMDGEGRVTKVTGGSTNLVSGVAYTNTGNGDNVAVGVISSVTYGTGDYDSFGYDPDTGRLTQYVYTVGSAGTTVTGNLGWNHNASLATLGIVDNWNSSNTQNCSYGYDDLLRLTGAGCTYNSTQIWNQTFSFDPFGNITKTGNVAFQPGYVETTNRFLSLPNLSYDSDGNLKNDSFHTYTWDADSNPLSIDSVSQTYDALGRMVEQNRGGAYTQVVYSPAGVKLALMNGQTLQRAFVSLPGGGSAVYNSSGLAYYRHADWLGSSRFASTVATPTSKYFDVAYAPYGEDYTDSGTTDLNFTGQNQDTVSGLYDFLYREYSPVQGRWVQPDPAGMNAVDLTNPQSWNRYAYVLNNPLMYIDPEGMDCAYLNDAGDGLDQNGLDHNSSEKECADNGGQWLNGTIQDGSVSANADTGQVWGTNSDGFIVTNDPGQSVTVNGGSGGSVSLLGGDSSSINWTWNFTRSSFGDFSIPTGPGSCIGVALDSAQPLLSAANKVQDYAKK